MGSLGDLSNNLRRWCPEKIPFMLSAKQVHGSIFRIQSMQPGQLSRLGKTPFSTALLYKKLIKSRVELLGSLGDVLKIVRKWPANPLPLLLSGIRLL